MNINQRGMLLVISGPSGAGKGTLVSRLLDKDPTFVFSVSVTTRERRENEIEDVHYHLFPKRNMINCLSRMLLWSMPRFTVTVTGR